MLNGGVLLPLSVPSFLFRNTYLSQIASARDAGHTTAILGQYRAFWDSWSPYPTLSTNRQQSSKL